MKVVDLKQRTPEWHIWRNAGVTASDAPVLVGSPCKTPWRLWAEKRGVSSISQYPPCKTARLAPPNPPRTPRTPSACVLPSRPPEPVRAAREAESLTLGGKNTWLLNEKSQMSKKRLRFDLNKFGQHESVISLCV